jgi:uroporphyrinogen decarboxylase
MQNGIPDRVPVAPDTSTYIPTKRTGLPFWEVLLQGRVPLWKAYLDVADYYGMDAWTAPVMGIPYTYDETQAEWHSRDVYDRERDAMIRHTTVRTPDGDLTQEEICFRADPPFTTKKFIENLRRDFRAYKWARPMPNGVDTKALEILRAACRERDYAFGITMLYPGFQNWNSYIQDGVEALAYAEMDTPDILQEWYEWDLERGTIEIELVIQSEVDYILFGGSGTITLASPKLARKYAIPALKKWSKRAKEAGIPTMLHSCGRNRALAPLLADETDIGMINPLEVPPMGDVQLAEIKQHYGDRLALMGNLHTTEVMLLGSSEFVEYKSVEAMRDAAYRGGFILSTGDQCGRDTPEENIWAVVNAAKQYGKYDRVTGALPDLPDLPAIVPG